MAGSFSEGFVQGCLPNVPFPFHSPRNQEVYDGQPHAILHRRRLGRSGRQEVHPRRQPGDRRGDVRGCARLQGRRRQGGGRGQARLRDVFADDPRGARGAALENHRGLQDPHEGYWRRRLRRDGRAAADGGEDAGRRRPRPPRITLEVLKNYHFEEPVGSAMVVREPVGVIGMITPWNWPLNQIACKVAPALAAGCTMLLKPSEFTPSSALIFAEILHEAGVPKGVFNLVNGLGPEVGAAMSEHPDIDMISFTGSTRAGVDVAKRAAPTVKRVSQELGGKSPNVILE